MVGADICGFTGEASVELCARWQALGSFYPFSRNHNTIEAKPQDPVAMGDTVVAATKNALRIRYTLLPYLYSVFYENFITGHPVIRSANWDSPWDENAELEAATQFLWGTSVMIIPAVEEGKQDVRGYFPTENNWFDFESLTEIKSKDDAKREHWYNIPLEKIVVTLKGASVIPYHVDPKMTTSQQHKESPFGLLVTLTQGQKSTGRLFWDDGETADTVNLGSYSLIEFEADNNKLKSIIREKNFKMNPLKEVKVLGIKSSVNEVKVNGKVTKEFKYDDKVQVLILDSLKQDLTSEFVIEWK
jgi:alpha-glucosidase (family GH31 glycosyl hydrolase)